MIKFFCDVCILLIMICLFPMVIVSSMSVSPTTINGNKKYFNLLNQQNLHSILISIDERLQNLDNLYALQCSSTLQAKLDYYGRKIDNIEKEMGRIEVRIRMDLDKISENISNRNFKDDIMADRIVKKIDAIFERTSKKMANIETQIDLNSIKLQNTRDILVSKLDRTEENLYIRDSDLEAEIADATAAIDDLKSTCSTVEENILNKTGDYFKQFTENITQSSEKISQIIKSLEKANNNIEKLDRVISPNYTDFEIILDRKKHDIEENINDFTNKMTDRSVHIEEEIGSLKLYLKNMASIVNLTRNEQQNGLRALTVLVGRKTGKQNSTLHCLSENQKLGELSDKIDKNFENMMLAQSLFLESCHKVQMDESQIESKISIILEKIIEIFENKTTVGPADLLKLEKLIFIHDSYSRQHMYELTKKFVSLQKKLGEDDRIMERISEIIQEENEKMKVHLAKADACSSNILKQHTTLLQALNKSISEMYIILNHTKIRSEGSYLDYKNIIPFLTIFKNRANKNITLENLWNENITMRNNSENITTDMSSIIFEDTEHSLPLYNKTLIDIRFNIDYGDTNNTEANSRKEKNLKVPEKLQKSSEENSSLVNITSEMLENNNKRTVPTANLNINTGDIQNTTKVYDTLQDMIDRVRQEIMKNEEANNLEMDRMSNATVFDANQFQDNFNKQTTEIENNTNTAIIQNYNNSITNLNSASNDNVQNISTDMFGNSSTFFNHDSNNNYIQNTNFFENTDTSITDTVDTEESNTDVTENKSMDKTEGIIYENDINSNSSVTSTHAVSTTDTTVQKYRAKNNLVQELFNYLINILYEDNKNNNK